MATDSAATARKPIDLEKARKVAAMLASDSDGEALAAARRLVAMASAAGIRVEDLVAAPVRAPRPFDQDAARRQAQAAGRADGWAAFGERVRTWAAQQNIKIDWAVLLERLVKREFSLTDDELQFLREASEHGLRWVQQRRGLWVPPHDMSHRLLAIARQYGISVPYE